MTTDSFVTISIPGNVDTKLLGSEPALLKTVNQTLSLYGSMTATIGKLPYTPNNPKSGIRSFDAAVKNLPEDFIDDAISIVHRRTWIIFPLSPADKTKLLHFSLEAREKIDAFDAMQTKTGNVIDAFLYHIHQPATEDKTVLDQTIGYFLATNDGQLIVQNAKKMFVSPYDLSQSEMATDFCVKAVARAEWFSTPLVKKINGHILFASIALKEHRAQQDQQELEKLANDETESPIEAPRG